MKKYLILMMCLISSAMIFGQNETKNVMVDIEEVSVTPPKFTGIENAAAILETDNSSMINRFLSQNLNYPLNSDEYWKEGTEVIQFTVTPSGMVTDFNVINSVCREIDEELIRVIKTTNGMWKPGYNNGEPIAMEKEVAVMFGDYKDNEIVTRFVQQAEKNFIMGGKNLFENHKPKKALKFYDLGVRYLPNDKALLMMRGICHYEIGDEESARKDWNRIVSLGGTNPWEIGYDLTEMKGYAEMTDILAKNRK